MHQDRIILEDEKFLEVVDRGIDIIANPVKKTLGPSGRNFFYTNQYNIPLVTNDGVTVARQIFTEDETEQAIVDAVKQTAMRTNMYAGDASTTFITLVQSIWKEGRKSDKHPLAKQEEIAEHAKTVLGELKSSAQPVKTPEDIKKVATISAQSEEIGYLIAEATEKVGKEGKIDVQESEINGVRVEYAPGLEIDEGYVAEFMMNNERGEAVLNEPYVLLVDSKVDNIKTILPVVQNLADNGITEVLLVCDGLAGNTLSTIARNKMAKYNEGKNVMEIFAVKFPTVKKQEFIEDIALVTQGKVFGLSTGIFPDQAPVCNQRNPQGQPLDPNYLQESKKFIEEHFGRCEKVVITQKRTTFIGGKGDIDSKIETLKNQRDNSEVKEHYDARIARLQGKTAVIKVGAPTQQDLSYLKDKIEDAIYATKGAIEEGSVKGGGVALKMIALDLPDGILKEALQAPYNQIQENAGGQLKIEPHVIDSVKSTRYAVENACNLVGSLLTATGSSVAKRIEPKN